MELYLLPKFDDSSPSVTQDKEICDITTSWSGLPNGTLSMIFTYCPNLMFLASLWLEIYRFCSLKLIFILLTLGRSKLTLSFLFYWLWMGHSYFIDLGKTYHEKPKNSRTRHRVWHKSFLMIQSAGIRKSFPQSINRPQRFSLLSLSVKRFLIFATK